MRDLASELSRFPNPIKRKKEIEALALYLQTNERILISLHGQGPYDATKTCWFVLTNYNVFIVLKASMRGASSVIVLPLKDIDSVVENRGMLLSQIVLMSKGVAYTLHNAIKDQTKTFVEQFHKCKAELTQQPVELSPMLNEEISTQSPIAFDEKKPSRKKKIIIAVFIVLLLGGIGNLLEDKNSAQKVADTKPTVMKKVYEYKILDEEHNKLGGARRFIYNISVPLGLTNEELTQLLTDVAWELQSKKGASGICIFAHRPDDQEIDDGYSAGKCVLAPYGIWEKAINSSSNLKAVIDISGAYADNTTPLTVGTKVTVNDDIDLLNKALNAEIGKVKKGTKITILEHRRTFTTYMAVDYYRVRIGKKDGWINGYSLK